jgi:hypothetical protein
MGRPRVRLGFPSLARTGPARPGPLAALPLSSCSSRVLKRRRRTFGELGKVKSRVCPVCGHGAKNPQDMVFRGTGVGGNGVCDTRVNLSDTPRARVEQPRETPYTVSDERETGTGNRLHCS